MTRMLTLWNLAMGLCIVQGSMAQGFNKRYDAFDEGYIQEAFGIERSGNGWMIITGSYEPDTIAPDSILGSIRIVLQRVDDNGNLIEEHRVVLLGHSIFPGWADCCDSTLGGGFVVSGSSQSYVGLTEARLMKLNAIGDTIWTKSFGGTDQFWLGEQVIQTNDSGFLIVGITDATGYQDAFVIKTDSLGNEQWRHTYGLESIEIDAFTSAVEISNGYILSGQSYPQASNSDMFAVRIDSLGNVVWSQRWGGVFDDVQVHSSFGQNGAIILAGGYGFAPDLLGTKPYLAYVDTADGEIVWSRTYGDSLFSTLLFAAKQLPNTDLIACGVTYEGGNQQGLLLRTTTAGDSLWMRNYAYHDSVIDQGQGRFWDVLPTADGGCIAAGVAYNPFGGPYPPGYSQDAWVVKVDSFGCIVPGCQLLDGITEQVTNLGEALTLWPNPLSLSKGDGQLHVGIHLPSNFTTTGPLTLSVTSMEGKLVARQSVPTSAPDVVKLNVSSLANGTYAIHLSDASRWLAGKKFVVQ